MPNPAFQKVDLLHKEKINFFDLLFDLLEKQLTIIVRR